MGVVSAGTARGIWSTKETTADGQRTEVATDFERVRGV